MLSKYGYVIKVNHADGVFQALGKRYFDPNGNLMQGTKNHIISSQQHI